MTKPLSDNTVMVCVGVFLALIVLAMVVGGATPLEGIIYSLVGTSCIALHGRVE